MKLTNIIKVKNKSWILANGKFQGRMIFPFVFIAESHIHNEAMIAHEQTHIKQFLQGRMFLYYFSKKARFNIEYEAYQVQADVSFKNYCSKYNVDKKSEEARKYYLDITSNYSNHLANKYNLGEGDWYDKAVKLFINHFAEMGQ